MSETFKQRVYRLIERSDADDRAGVLFDRVIFTLIGLNAIALTLETVDPIRARVGDGFFYFELFSVTVFTLEYVLRWWSCTSDPRHARPIVGRLRWMMTPFALVDLLAFLPFYLPMLGVDMRFVRVVRFMRWFRLIKIGRYSTAVRSLGHVLLQKREELVIVMAVVLMILVLSSTLMYYAEHEAQPDAFSSVPAAMWWSVATLTTVGYGDIYPMTPLGRIMGAVVALLGIGLVALPTGMLGAAFVEEIENRKSGPRICPHCQKELH